MKMALFYTSTLLVLCVVHLHLCSILHSTSTNNNTSTSTSTKKGLCVAPEFFLCGDVTAFTGISWYYNWGTNPVHEDHPECEGGKAPPGFIPMIWGYWGQEFPALEYDTVLGFNEPNHADQANMDPEVAAYAWLRLQEAYPDKTLVSPSASPPHTEEWFDQFFEVCDVIGCRVDYLATHAYTGNAGVDIGILNGLYQRYKKKVWFTEFAKPSTRDPEEELNYMKAILPLLEESEAVWRYSWFVTRWPHGARSNTTSGEWYLDKVVSLLEQDSATLTPLGQYYNDF